MVGHIIGQIRLYAHDKNTTKSRLITWSQRRCKICQRFLSKKQKKYCVKCAENGYKIYDKSYRSVYYRKFLK